VARRLGVFLTKDFQANSAWSGNGGSTHDVILRATHFSDGERTVQVGAELFI
jgi:hypothetical protein